MNIIDDIEKKQMKPDLEPVDVGDTISVSKTIVEGKKKRIQKFEGVVIKKQGRLSRETITVRKVIDGVGVEKSFLLHSPLVPAYKIVKRAKVRRAKLFYLRERLGVKASRLKPR
ncbi:MAG: 50S ribosomal protein L19 [bacterium]